MPRKTPDFRAEAKKEQLRKKHEAQKTQRLQDLQKVREPMAALLMEVEKLDQNIETQQQKFRHAHKDVQVPNQEQEIERDLAIMRLRSEQVKRFQAFLKTDLSLLLENEEVRHELLASICTIGENSLMSAQLIVKWILEDRGGQHPVWLENVTSLLAMLEKDLTPFLQRHQTVSEAIRVTAESQVQKAINILFFLDLYNQLSSVPYDNFRKAFKLLQEVHEQLAGPIENDRALVELLVGILEDRERQFIQKWSASLAQKVDACEPNKLGLFEREVGRFKQLINNWYYHYSGSRRTEFFSLPIMMLGADRVLKMVHQCTLWISEYEVRRREQQLAVNAATVIIAPKLAEANKESLSPPPVQTPEQKLEQLNMKEVQDALEACEGDWTKATQQIIDFLQVEEAKDPFLLAEAYHKISGFLHQCVVWPNQNTLTCNCQLLSEAFRLCELAQQISLKNQGQDPARTGQLVWANAWQMEEIIRQKEQMVERAQERLDADLERSRIKKEAAKARKGEPKPKVKNQKTEAQEAWREELGLLSETFKRELESKERHVQEADNVVLEVRQKLSSPKIGTRNHQVAAEAAVS